MNADNYESTTPEIHNQDLKARIEFLKANYIPLWQSGLEMEMLIEHMKSHGHTQNDVFVELGSAHMGSTYIYSMFVKPGGLIVSVDMARPRSRRFYKIVLKTLRDRYNVAMITKDTASAVDEVREVTGGKIDYLHIDADHTYEGSKSDFDNYSPMVRSGGVIQMHDILLGKDLPGTDMGVFTLWKELKETHQTYEFVDKDFRDKVYVGSLVGTGVIEVP